MTLYYRTNNGSDLRRLYDTVLLDIFLNIMLNYQLGIRKEKKMKIELPKLLFNQIYRSKMESLIRQIKENNNIDLDDLKETLVTSCDFSKLNKHECMDLFAKSLRTDGCINLFQSLINNSISLHDLENIEFEKFSNTEQQSMLGIMLQHNVSTDLICVLLNKMKSVNYGEYASAPYPETINPLLHCCEKNKLDLVKILIEKNGAEIEYLGFFNKTAIQYSDEKFHMDIIKYLYEKGAKYRSPCMEQYIKQWDSNKQLLNNYEQLILDYDRLQQKYNSIIEYFKNH